MYGIHYVMRHDVHVRCSVYTVVHVHRACTSYTYKHGLITTVAPLFFVDD